jgi:hypothetical protein
MVRGHILDEDAREFIVANPTVEPAQEQRELHQRGERGGQVIKVEEAGHGGASILAIRILDLKFEIERILARVLVLSKQKAARVMTHPTCAGRAIMAFK